MTGIYPVITMVGIPPTIATRMMKRIENKLAMIYASQIFLLHPPRFCFLQRIFAKFLFRDVLIWQDEIPLLFLSRNIYITEILSLLPFSLLFSRSLIAYFPSLTQILQITDTIYFVRIFVTFVCIFRILRRLNRLFQKYHLIYLPNYQVHLY